MSEHTPEPWEMRKSKYPVDGAYDWAIGAEVDDGGPYCIAECVGRAAEQLWLPAEANARRIVACVNACQGIPTEALEQETVKEMLDRLGRAYRRAIQTHEALNSGDDTYHP